MKLYDYKFKHKFWQKSIELLEHWSVRYEYYNSDFY